MNANNVIPYGALVHEAASAGGVEAYKAAQQQLIDTVKRNSFNEGVEEERNQLLPWLLISSAVAVGLGIKQFAPIVKEKFDNYREKREKLRKEAITAEKMLVDNYEVTQENVQEEN